MYEYEQDTQRWRDREIGTRDVMFIPNSNNYNNNNNQPQLKVTKSLYIVIVLGQLPFTLFIEMAQTWVFQRDSVNTTIIHSYSTSPVMGVYMG